MRIWLIDPEGQQPRAARSFTAGFYRPRPASRTARGVPVAAAAPRPRSTWPATSRSISSSTGHRGARRCGVSPGSAAAPASARSPTSDPGLTYYNADIPLAAALRA